MTLTYRGIPNDLNLLRATLFSYIIFSSSYFIFYFSICVQNTKGITRTSYVIQIRNA
jgi:hypothetical protein